MAGARYRHEVPSPNSEQIRVLLTHPWPGNVRGLCNIADRYVLLGENVGYDLAILMRNVDSEAAITLPQQVDCF